MCMRTKWILLAEFQRWDGRLYAEIIWNLNEFLSFWVLWNFVTISKLTIEFFVIRLNQLFQKWKQTNNQRSGTKQKLLFYSFTIAFCCGYQFLSILENTNFVCGKLKENVYSKDGSERAIWSTWLFLSSKLWDAKQILGCQIKRDTILVTFLRLFFSRNFCSAKLLCSLWFPQGNRFGSERNKNDFTQHKKQIVYE